MRAVIARVVILVVAILAFSAVTSAQQLVPTDLSASTNGSNVVITWRAASGTAPDGFRLEAGSGTGLADLAIVNLPWSGAAGGEAQFAATGVAPGVYFLRVRAVYAAQVSEPSEEIVLRVASTTCPLPNAPRNVSATVGGEVVTLDWEPSTGGSASGYVIEAGSTPGVPNLAILTLQASSISVSAPPGRYFVRLRAMGMCGTSEPSPEVVIVVP